MQTEQDLLDHLRRHSSPYCDPLDRIRWDALDASGFWLPESALSLFGTDLFESLDLEQRQQLSRYEFAYFISGALWLEGLFMERIARATMNTRGALEPLHYRLHELREEAGHSLMFVEFLRRSGLQLPNNRFPKPRLATWIGRHAPFESAAFWIAVLIGEEVPDRMNRLIRKHRDQISPTVHDIVSLHMVDEARHMAHARDTVGRVLETLSTGHRLLYRPLMRVVFRQFVQAFYFPSADVYRLAGLPEGVDYPRAARNNPTRRAFVDDCVADALSILRSHGLQLDWR